MDYGDGDLGLQGMTLEDGSPQQTKQQAFTGIRNDYAFIEDRQKEKEAEIRPNAANVNVDAIKNTVLNSAESSKKIENQPRISISSIRSSSSIYHSADEEASSSFEADQDEEVKPKGKPKAFSDPPETPTLNRFPNTLNSRVSSSTISTSTPNTPTIEMTPRMNGNSDLSSSHIPIDKGKAKERRSSLSSVRTKEKEERKLKKQLYKLHNEIAGPAAERPIAGSAEGPILSPRRTSAVISKRLSSSRKNSEGKELSSPDNSSSPMPSPSAKSFNKSISDSTASSSSPFQDVSDKTGLGILSVEPKVRLGSHPTPYAMLRINDNFSYLQETANATSAPPSLLKFGKKAYKSQLDVAALQRWVLSVGCVNFDLEKGPDLEFLYPSLGISREERDNIAFSSFPDTSIFDDGHAVFSWRVREVPLDSSGSEAPIIGTPVPIREHPQRENSIPDSHHTVGGARKLFGRGLLHRSNSGEKGDDSSNNGHSQNSSAGYEPLLTASPKMSENSQGTFSQLTLPRRQNSAASTPSNLSADNQTVAEHAQALLRAVSPAISISDHDATQATGMNTPKRGSSTSSNYIHGYCFFRQKRDATIRRGYFQKSLVILSHLPYVSFFSELVRRLGPLYFEKGMPILEAFCHDVQNWEPPEPGAKLHLPFLGSVISVELPYYSYSQSSPLPEAQRALTQRVLTSSGGPKVSISDPRTLKKTDGSSEAAPILASIPNTPLFEIFQDLIGDLWLMWECLLLAEPILVVGPDPTACSEAVWHMLDLIKPIPFAGDFRPFFTIHDFDFRTLVTKNKPNAGTIIGVTNPFMLQACKHWPHVLKVGKGASKKTIGHMKRFSEASMTSHSVSSSIGSSTLSGVKPSGRVAGGNTAGGGGPEHTPGLISKRKRRVSKDRALIKQLVDASEGRGCNPDKANELLRKYFADITERFLAPLNRYVSSLIPADFDLSSPYETPRIRPFNTTAFLASLKMYGTPLPLKSKNLPTGPAIRQSLYVDFLQCPNFSLWLHMRIRQSQEEQYMRKLRALETGNVASFATAKGEVESVELYARLHIEIKGINERLLSGRKERELEPNSRWKCSSTKENADVVGEGLLNESGDVAHHNLNQMEPESFSPSSTFDDRFETILASQPVNQLANLPPTTGSADWIRKTIGEPGWQRSFTLSERTLLMRKAGLIDQLQRLLCTLPEDLRQSLQLKVKEQG